MKKLILLLCYALPVLATGNLMIYNTDFKGPSIIAVLEGLGNPNKCFIIHPSIDYGVNYPSSTIFPDSFDTTYQRVNGWVRLYQHTQFDPDIKKALALCNNREYLNVQPVYERYVNIPNQDKTPNVMIKWPEDAQNKGNP